MTYDDAERRMVALAKTSRFLNNSQQVAELTLTLCRSLVGLSVLAVARIANRAERKENEEKGRQEQVRRRAAQLDPDLLNDLIRRSRRSSVVIEDDDPPIQEAEVVGD
jgi:hypothetical protein